MLKSYLFVFNEIPVIATRAIILQYLETRPEVRNWYTCFSHAIVIVSDRSTTVLRDVIKERFSSVYFVIAEVNQFSTNGWAPKEFWNFVNNSPPNR